MNDALLTELPAWLTQAGLAGTAETDIVNGFCERCVAGGIPLGRVHLFIDTLHPVHEGVCSAGDTTPPLKPPCSSMAAPISQR